MKYHHRDLLQSILKDVEYKQPRDILCSDATHSPSNITVYTIETVNIYINQSAPSPAPGRKGVP